MSVEVQKHLQQSSVLLFKLLYQIKNSLNFHDILAFQRGFALILIVESVQIIAHNSCPIVAQNNPIDIDHGNYYPEKIIGRVLDEMIHESLHHPGSYGLSWVLSGNRQSHSL